MAKEVDRSLIDREVAETMRQLAELLLQLRDAMAVAAQARPILDKASICLQHLAKTGMMPALPVDLYMINENGNRKTVTADKAERIRQKWSGDFLLDLPRQTLQIQRGNETQKLRLGTSDLHWGVQQVLIVGMSQPSIAFGFNTFRRTEPKGGGISSVKTLTRYIHEARKALGDLAYETRYIHKTRVDPYESPSRWGYVFDDRWSYLVIATCPPEIMKKSWKSIEQSTDAGSSIHTSFL
jgi:hypothetical protein